MKSTNAGAGESGGESEPRALQIFAFQTKIKAKFREEDLKTNQEIVYRDGEAAVVRDRVAWAPILQTAASAIFSAIAAKVGENAGDKLTDWIFGKNQDKNNNDESLAYLKLIVKQ